MVQLQFSGRQYVAVRCTAGSPDANVVVPNQAKPNHNHQLQLYS